MSALLLRLCVDVRSEAEHLTTQCQRLERRLLTLAFNDDGDASTLTPLSMDERVDVLSAIAGGVSLALLDHQTATDALRRRITDQRLCRYDTYVHEDTDGRRCEDAKAAVLPGEMVQSLLTEHDSSADVDRQRSTISDQDRTSQSTTIAARFSPPIHLENEADNPRRSFQDNRWQSSFSAYATTDTDSADEFPNDDHLLHSDLAVALCPAADVQPLSGDDGGQSRTKRARRQVNYSTTTSTPQPSVSVNESTTSSRQLRTIKLEQNMAAAVPPLSHERVALATAPATMATVMPLQPDTRLDFHDRLVQCTVVETRRVTYSSGDWLAIRCFEGGGTQLFCEDDDVGGEGGGAASAERRLCPPADCLATAGRHARAELNADDRQSRRGWQPWRVLATATHAYARAVLVYYERGLQRPVVYSSKIKRSNRGGTAVDLLAAQPCPVRDAFRLAVTHLRADFAAYSDAERQRVLVAALEMLYKNVNKALSRHFRLTVG